ncbi:MAG TPA: ribonucleotide reductase N-terminal alpha domain-containing protein, partial [Bacillota bacterium]
MELSSNARAVLERRYLQKKDGKVIESPEDLLRRVARTIAGVEATAFGTSQAEVAELTEKFFAVMDQKKFMPNSPTLMNAGRELGQLSACFVLPIEDSMESIFESLKLAALIHKSGGG